MTEHATRESFMVATGRPRNHMRQSPTVPEGITPAEANSAILQAYRRARMTKEKQYPILATDAQIRAAMRTGQEQ